MKMCFPRCSFSCKKVSMFLLKGFSYSLIHFIICWIHWTPISLHVFFVNHVRRCEKSLILRISSPHIPAVPSTSCKFLNNTRAIFQMYRTVAWLFAVSIKYYLCGALSQLSEAIVYFRVQQMRFTQFCVIYSSYAGFSRSLLSLKHFSFQSLKD